MWLEIHLGSLSQRDELIYDKLHAACIWLVAHGKTGSYILFRWPLWPICASWILLGSQISDPEKKLSVMKSIPVYFIKQKSDLLNSYISLYEAKLANFLLKLKYCSEIAFLFDNNITVLISITE